MAVESQFYSVLTLIDEYDLNLQKIAPYYTKKSPIKLLASSGFCIGGHTHPTITFGSREVNFSLGIVQFLNPEDIKAIPGKQLK